MKKILLGVSIVAVLSTTLYAFGTFTGSQTSGVNKICFYSDGSAITVSAGSICPVSN